MSDAKRLTTSLGSYVSFARGKDHVSVILWAPDDFRRSDKAFFFVARQHCRRVLKVFEPISIASDDQGVTYHFDPFFAPAVKAVLPKLRARLRTVMEANLTPRQVTQALDISSNERLRWTRDGRLRNAGRLLSDRTVTTVSMPLYDMQQVLQLIREPDIIARWRLADG